MYTLSNWVKYIQRRTALEDSYIELYRKGGLYEYGNGEYLVRRAKGLYDG